MSNIMAVSRLRYNDHGVTHARIVAGASLEITDILIRHNTEFTTLRDGTAKNLDEVKLIVLLSGYLHDIGNAVHRQSHEFIGALLSKSILDRILSRIPYRLGKVDMHSVSALSIKRVEISEGEPRPIKISVYVSDMAGLFQLEAVLLPKIRTSLLEDLIEVTLYTDSKTLRFYPK
jgi:metal-dependent HD superfamily phosphatase/phosphodiesterase